MILSVLLPLLLARSAGLRSQTFFRWILWVSWLNCRVLSPQGLQRGAWALAGHPWNEGSLSKSLEQPVGWEWRAMTCILTHTLMGKITNTVHLLLVYVLKHRHWSHAQTYTHNSLSPPPLSLSLSFMQLHISHTTLSCWFLSPSNGCLSCLLM